MDVRCKLAPAVGVAQEVAYDGEDGADNLDRDVEAGADDLKKARRQLRSSGLDRKRLRRRTPRTMPVGKMIPKERICITMCTHSVAS